MWSLIRGEPEAVIRWAGPLLVVGLLLGFASTQLEAPLGVITSVFAIALGAVGGTFIHWRQERGLWMLAVFFMLVFGAIYAMFVFGQVRDIVRGARQPDVGVMIDGALGTLLLLATLRFLRRMAKDNWTFSRESGNA